MKKILHVGSVKHKSQKDVTIPDEGDRKSSKRKYARKKKQSIHKNEINVQM